jgi:hypothetical protein
MPCRAGGGGSGYGVLRFAQDDRWIGLGTRIKTAEDAEGTEKN